MHPQLRTLLATSLVATLPAAPAAAQRLSRPSLTVSAGRDLHGDHPFRLAAVGAQWSGRRGLGVRLEATYAARPDEHTEFFPPGVAGPCLPASPCVNGPVRVTNSVAAYGAMLSPTFELRASSRVRPFVLGGVGALATHERERRAVTLGCPLDMLCGSAPTDASEDASTRWRVAVQAGAGVAVRVGALELTGEMRYLHADDQGPRGAGSVVPLTFGVRF